MRNLEKPFGIEETTFKKKGAELFITAKIVLTIICSGERRWVFMRKWFIRKDGQQYGPVDSIELKEKAESGELRPEDYVRPDDFSDWMRASTIRGLFELNTNNSPSSSNRSAETRPAGNQERHWVRIFIIVLSVISVSIVVSIIAKILGRF
jgi:hypothetical protein